MFDYIMNTYCKNRNTYNIHQKCYQAKRIHKEFMYFLAHSPNSKQQYDKNKYPWGKKKGVDHMVHNPLYFSFQDFYTKIDSIYNLIFIYYNYDTIHTCIQ